MKNVILVLANCVFAALAGPTPVVADTSNATVAATLPNTYAEMEAAITDLMLGKSAFGATPMGGSVKKIKQLITKTMMPKVITAHKEDQRELNKLANEIKKCGKTKDNAFKTAAPSGAKYKSNSKSHKSCRSDEAIKLTSLRTCRAQEKALLQIKNLKCNAFAAISKKWGTQKNNAVVIRKGGGESVLSYITRLSITFCGSHVHGTRGTKSRPGG
jgi:hypothetical protein